MKKASTADIAYNYIISNILSGKFRQGMPISELELSKDLNISRSPIREAFRKLEADGLIIIYPGRGSFVITISDDDIREIFELRSLIECHGLEKSYLRFSTNYLGELKNKISALDPTQDKNTEFYKMDFELHYSLVRYSGNSRLIKYYKNLLLQIDMIRRISSINPKHFENSKTYHLNLINAIYNRNIKIAKSILIEHLDDVLENTLIVYKLNRESIGNSYISQ